MLRGGGHESGGQTHGGGTERRGAGRAHMSPQVEQGSGHPLGPILEVSGISVQVVGIGGAPGMSILTLDFAQPFFCALQRTAGSQPTQACAPWHRETHAPEFR